MQRFMSKDAKAIFIPNVGALIIGIGFLGPTIYYKYNKEPPAKNSIGVIIEAVILNRQRSCRKPPEQSPSSPEQRFGVGHLSRRRAEPRNYRRNVLKLVLWFLA